MFYRHLSLLLLLIAVVLGTGCRKASEVKKTELRNLSTVAGFNREFGEPFGVAIDQSNAVYISDGDKNSIFKLTADGTPVLVSDQFNTPSAIAFDAENNLIVVDTGSHTIKKLDIASGKVSTVAGIENRRGWADGNAAEALFNAPIGIAVANHKIYVADTYNDRIRLIEKGIVSTLAGGERGFRDGFGTAARFDTPTGLALWLNGELIVADTENARLRVVEDNGSVWTLAGSGDQNLKDGILFEAALSQPTALAVASDGAVFVADGNAVRSIKREDLMQIGTVNNSKRGFADGEITAARLNRPSGLAFDNSGRLWLTDSDNQVVRVLTDAAASIAAEQIARIRTTAEEFRALQTPRWTYNPPEARREIAGTLGEIRGAIAPGKQAWFHNGLDIAGAYGETARFIRTEKVLHPVAAEGFGGLRERLRMPTIGYIHLRLGRDKNDQPFDDARFVFDRTSPTDSAAQSANSKPVDVRVARGTKFEAGEAIGTLNSFNHVHLIAGRAGAEMNALAALVLPDLSDTLAPQIERVFLTDENWQPLETKTSDGRIKISGRVRIVARAFDQMDGGAARRKLGVYRLGYQILDRATDQSNEIKWTLVFDRMPDEDFVSRVYAPGSRSGYTPETVFDYIVTNSVSGETATENFLDTQNLPDGKHTLRVWAGDFFGNNSYRDIEIAVEK